MSDTDNLLDGSESTLENAPIEKILSGLELAAADAALLGDFLLYSTVLDIHLSNPQRYSNEDREQLLAHLLAVLSADDALVREIGWDLPALLLPYIDLDHAFVGPLRLAPCVYKVLKIFEVLAHKGNAKELFLKSTELLSTVRVADGGVDTDHAANFYDIKLYCIFELIDSCMRRIHTVYPSRFLGMTVTSFVNAVYINPPANVSTVLFFLKRCYGFARNYVRPPLPQNPGVLPAELAKISDDEDYLQRKLLTAFLTESVNLAMRTDQIGLAVDFFNYLQELTVADKRVTNNYKMDLPVMKRLFELAGLFDLDLSAIFTAFVASSEALVDACVTPSLDDTVAAIFEKTVVDFQKNMAYSLVDSEANNVKESLSGCLTLFAFSVGPERNLDKVSLSMKQAIAITLRLVLPGFVHPTFTNRGLQDVAVFWSWFTVHSLLKTPRKLELEIAAIPAPVLLTYLQALLFATVSTSNSLYFRYTTFTLLTKILSLAPEDVAYTFLKNSLLDCPFENAKAALVGVLKELLTKNRESPDDLPVLEVSLDAPPLPSRQAKSPEKFIHLTPDRAGDILEAIDKHIGMTFPEQDSEPLLNVATLPTLQALLNLLILLKRDPLIAAKVTSVVDLMLLEIALREEAWKGDDAKANELNAVGLLGVTVDRLKGN